MPRLNGIDATAQIVQSSPHIGVLVLTMMEDEESVFAAVRAGARGYLLKGARRDEIVRAVQAVGAGEVIFGPGIAERVMTYFSSARSRPSADAFPDLTARERVVLDLIAEGRRTARSRDSWACRSRPCATTPATSSPSCRSPTGRRRSSRRARPGWGERQPEPSRQPPWRRASSRASLPTAAACACPGRRREAPNSTPKSPADDAGRRLGGVHRRERLDEPEDLGGGQVGLEAAERGQRGRPPCSPRRPPRPAAARARRAGTAGGWPTGRSRWRGRPSRVRT